ncbi:hypothetical protein MMC11_001612 [Xylographa trunciseda]|nr:hypothetical protein [Xylographa trunciseda]
MEPVFLGQPVFNPRPISPLSFESFEPLPEDVILPGSSDEDSEGTRGRKKRRREDIGYQYLRQQAGYTITFKLKGPFEKGWRNPYRDHGVVLTAAQVRDMRYRREERDQPGVRASSPIDLTSGAEEEIEDGKLPVRKLRDRKEISTENGWLTSNVHGVGKRPSEDAEAASPTPRRQARVQQSDTFVFKGAVGNDGALGPGKLIQAIDRVEGMHDKLEEEELDDLENDPLRIDPEDHRSPSVELEYSSQSQGRYREASELSEGGHLDVQSPTTKPRLERRVLVKRIKDIRHRLDMKQYGSDTVDELRLEEEVLDDRITALSAVITDMKESGTDDFTPRKKRSRDQLHKDTGSLDMLAVQQTRFEEANNKSLTRIGTNTNYQKADIGVVSTRDFLPTSLQDASRVNGAKKVDEEVIEQGAEVDMNPDLIRVPSFRTDSSEISHAVSSGSNGKQRSARAIRKSEKRREQKREKRQKVAREKLTRQQGEDAQTMNVNKHEDKSQSGELGPPSKTLATSTKIEQPRRPRERKLGWDFEIPGLVTEPGPSIDEGEVLDATGTSDTQQNEETKTKTKTLNQPKRPVRKKYQCKAKEMDVEIAVENKKVALDVNSSEAVAVGTKGERVPIIIVDDYDSLASSFQVSLVTASPTGWKPYKWLPGGQVHAELVLREHLASIEASGPSLDPFRSSVDSSSNESPTTERKRNVRETKAELRRLSNDNIIDLTDHEMPEAPPEAVQLRSLGTEVGFDIQHKTLKPQEESRRTSIDSVDTAWKKDQSRFFGESLSGGAKEPTTNLRPMREYSTHQQEVSMQSGKVARFDLRSIPREGPGHISNASKKPSTLKRDGVPFKDTSDQENQQLEMIEEEKKASRALTAALVSFMDTSSDEEARENDQRSYTHSAEDVSLGRDQLPLESVLPTETNIQFGPTENVLVANDHRRKSPPVAVDEMAPNDAKKIALKDSAAAKDLTTGTLQNKKDQQKSLNERRSSREEFLQSLRLHVSQKGGKNLLTAGLDATMNSPYVLPASTNLSQFQYNRVDTSSRSTSSDHNPPQRKQKQKPATPVYAKAQGKRRISFTPNGNVKRGIEVRVPLLSPHGSQSSPIVIEDAPVRMQASPSKKSAPSLSQKPSESDASKSIAEILPEAQIVVEKVPSGPSTNLLETDKQSLKFPSIEENDSSEHFSTPAELAKAQQSFQRDLQSPVKLQDASLPQTSPLRRTSTSELDRDVDPSKTPLLTSKDPYIGAPRPHSSSQELPSTQAMVDAMSPFAISTTKKPRKFLHTLTRPAAAVYDYIWGGSQEERNIPVIKPQPVDSSTSADPTALPAEASVDPPPSPMPASPNRPAPTLDPAFTFNYPPFDMATSDSSPSSPAYELSQPPEFIKPPRRRSRKLNSTLPPDEDEASDFEESQKQRGLVRDDRGRWSNLTTELSMVTPSQRTLRSFNSPRTGSERKGRERAFDGLSQDGQRRSGLEAAVEEAESWLGTWDVEGEMRKMGKGASASGSGGGAARRGGRNAVVL